MRSLAHLTPFYIFNRIKVMINEKRYPEHPWLTYAMVNILETVLKKTDIGLEFGSGRSTLWFAKRVQNLISVEHDPFWYEKISIQLQSHESGSKVKYHLFKDGKTELAESEYVKFINSIPKETLDFILIDGVCRDHCANHSLSRIKSGGFLIIDNVNWFIPRPEVVKSISPSSLTKDDDYVSPIWADVGEQILHWRYIWTTDGVTDTALFQKPITC